MRQKSKKNGRKYFSIGFLDRFSATLSVFPSNENFLKYKHIYKLPFINVFSGARDPLAARARSEAR